MSGAQLLMKQRILLFNFFSGVLQRGIPLYVDNLSVALESAGFRCVQFRCPQFLRRAPRPLLNLLFVFCEQLIAPLLGLAYHRSIYPYNSVPLFALFSRRTAVVVHDFISNHRRKGNFSSIYVTATQKLYAICGGTVIYASQITQRIGQRGRRFPRSQAFCFPNTFYGILRLRSSQPPPRGNAVLLCTGWGAHKDITGALRLYVDSGLVRCRPLEILGLAGHAEAVEAFCAAHPEVARQIAVFPRLDDQEVVYAYETAAWVWIHTLREGYGRSLAEARLCGSRVVASDIAPFREQRDPYTFLYSGLNAFRSAMQACESACPNPPRRPHREHHLLMSEIDKFVRQS